MMGQIEPRRLMEAAAWRTHLAEAGIDWSEELQAWLAEDPQNATAWRQVQATWELLGEQATAPELIRLRRVALAHVHGTGRSRSNRPRRFTVRVNRYASHPIVVGDDATSGLRISGVFHTGEVDGFVSTIVSYLPVRAQRAAGGSIRLTSR